MNHKIQSFWSWITENSYEGIDSASEGELEADREINEVHNPTLNHCNDESEPVENDETSYVIFVPPSSQNVQESTRNSPRIKCQAVPVIASRRSLCRRSCAGLMYCLTYLLQSLYYTVLPILLILPISAIVVSVKHIHNCPLDANLPVMLFNFGIFAALGLVVRIAVFLINKLCETSEDHDDVCTLPKTTYRVLDFLITLCLCIEAFEVLRVYEASPSPHSWSQNFCHPALYNFAYWMTWTAISIAILYFILQISRNSCD